MEHTISKKSHFLGLKGSFFAFIGVCAMVVLLSSSIASANTPTLSVSPTGDGNTVAVNVFGDANVSVIMYYRNGSGSQILTLGTTNSSGSLSSDISSSSYGILSGSPVYVSTNGVSGPISATTTWPTVNTTGGNIPGLTLSQTGVVLPIGQSTTVTASVNNSTAGSLYVSNNSNPSVANINLSGTQINITGIAYGSTTATICTVGNTTNCPSIYITVQNNGAQSLVFSQNNITLASGQNVPITVTGGTGVYTILNNSNTAAVQASISGQTVYLSTTGTYGASSITVCTTDTTSCGIINATVGTTNTGSISFSQTNPTLTVGQTTTVSIYGGSGSTYYISSNSNPNVVEASASNGVVSLTGITNGSTTLSVCSSTGGCGTLTVSVNYTSSGGNIALSQSSLTLVAGQTLSLTVSGGVAPYNLPVTSSSIFQATINANILTISGLNAGSAQVAVCSASGGCTWLSLIVNGSVQTTPTGTVGGSYLTFNTSTPTVAAGQSTVVYVSGGQGTGYTIPYDSNSNIARASISGNALTLTGVLNGYAVVVACDQYNDCGPLYVGVGVSNTPVVTTPPVITTTPGTTTAFVFTQHLDIGASGTEVIELQRLLTSLGLYSGRIDGGFGLMTQQAVERYQSSHNLPADGDIGPNTRAALNTGR